MNKIILYILIALVALALLAAGLGLGVFYQMKKDEPKLRSVAEVWATLSSNLISSITVNGAVQKIDGKNITLSSEGHDIIVDAGNSKIISFNFEKADGGKEADLSSIKQGDVLNISVKIYPNGAMTAQNILLLPIVTKK